MILWKWCVCGTGLLNTQPVPQQLDHEQLSTKPHWLLQLLFSELQEKGNRKESCCNAFLHASVWWIFYSHLHLSVVTSSCSSSAELSAGVFHGAIDPGALLSGCILPAARALQWCYLAEGEGKGANRSIYLEAGLPGAAEPGWELAAHQLLSAKVLWYNLKFLLLVTQG